MIIFGGVSCYVNTLPIKEDQYLTKKPLETYYNHKRPLALFDTRSKDIPQDITPKKKITEEKKYIPIQEYTVGTSFENRPIRSIVIGEGKDTILILASIHGDEKAGTPLVIGLSKYLYKNPHLLQGRKVMLLPLVNPDGANRNSRYNARGVDLNRNFAAWNRQNSHRYGFSALSEPESQSIVRAILQSNPKRIVAIHQDMSCIDYDGPGKNIAMHIAKYCALPVCKLGARPGSLGSYAGLTLGIPIVTFELPKNAEKLNHEILWQKYGNALVASVIYPREF